MTYENKTLCAWTYVCYLGKNKKTKQYGVLVRNVLQNAPCGTCLMYDASLPPDTTQDGILWTIGYSELKKAWMRMNNKDPSSPFKPDCPEVKLHLMLGARKEMGPSFDIEIDNAEREFNRLAELDHMVKLKKLDAARLKLSNEQGTLSKSAERQPTHDFPGFELGKPYPIGTKIAAFFKHHEAHGKPKPKKGSGRQPAGRVYDGEVTGMDVNGYKQRIYMCQFRTLSLLRPPSFVLRPKQASEKKTPLPDLSPPTLILPLSLTLPPSTTFTLVEGDSVRDRGRIKADGER
jgi:hypothetical protein